MDLNKERTKIKRAETKINVILANKYEIEEDCCQDDFTEC